MKNYSRASLYPSTFHLHSSDSIKLSKFPSNNHPKWTTLRSKSFPSAQSQLKSVCRRGEVVLLQSAPVSQPRTRQPRVSNGPSSAMAPNISKGTRRKSIVSSRIRRVIWKALMFGLVRLTRGGLTLCCFGCCRDDSRFCVWWSLALPFGVAPHSELRLDKWMKRCRSSLLLLLLRSLIMGSW